MSEQRLSDGDLERMRLSDRAHAENGYEDASLPVLDRRDLLAEIRRLHDDDPSNRWRPEVIAFANAMEARLSHHDDSRGTRGWSECDPKWLLQRLRQEVDELEKALAARHQRCACREAMCPHSLFEHPESVGHEAADVGNFAMMIADVRGELPR